MNAVLNRLAALGVETEDTLRRLMGDETLYLEYLRSLKENKDIVALRAAVAEQDGKKAENAVHTLKGVALNLGLLPLSDVCVDMLEELRAGNVQEGFALLPQVERQFEALANAAAED